MVALDWLTYVSATGLKVNDCVGRVSTWVGSGVLVALGSGAVVGLGVAVMPG